MSESEIKFAWFPAEAVEIMQVALRKNMYGEVYQHLFDQFVQDETEQYIGKAISLFLTLGVEGSRRYIDKWYGWRQLQRIPNDQKLTLARQKINLLGEERLDPRWEFVPTFDPKLVEHNRAQNEREEAIQEQINEDHELARVIQEE